MLSLQDPLALTSCGKSFRVSELCIQRLAAKARRPVIASEVLRHIEP